MTNRASRFLRTNTTTNSGTMTVVVPAATLVANDDAGPFDERTQGLTLTAVTPGPDTHGTVALAGGNVTFVPEAGFAGTAVIGYTVCDDGTTNGAPDPRCAASDSDLSKSMRRPADSRRCRRPLPSQSPGPTPARERSP